MSSFFDSEKPADSFVSRRVEVVKSPWSGKHTDPRWNSVTWLQHQNLPWLPSSERDRNGLSSDHFFGSARVWKRQRPVTQKFLFLLCYYWNVGFCTFFFPLSLSHLAPISSSHLITRLRTLGTALGLQRTCQAKRTTLLRPSCICNSQL